MLKAKKFRGPISNSKSMGGKVLLSQLSGKQSRPARGEHGMLLQKETKQKGLGMWLKC
jgi:hypothetical protein